ncbi:MAG: N-acetyltransferase [Candidatus Aminicenantes bacterium]|nr:N-acetyltransferase [Candidatus Aminicenantes bacterium]
MKYEIIPMTESHWEPARAIFEEGLNTGGASFETSVPSWEEWNDTHLPDCRLVAWSGKDILGWAALSPVSDRCVYAGVAEVSVYVGETYRGLGIGFDLLTSLIQESENNGIWTLQAGIFPENKASVDLHLKSGFKIVGKRERLGKLNGVWRDVLFLEHRSTKVGVD